MSDTSVIAILASVGILLAGSVTADAAALAGAIQKGDPIALQEFVKQYPESRLAPDALWLAAEVTNDRPSDSAQSVVNPGLTCNLDIVRTSEGKAMVTWSMTGAATASLHPLGFKKGVAIPAAGSKEIDDEGYVRVTLVVQDVAGNSAECSVVLHSRDIKLDDNGGFNSTPTYVLT